MAANHVKIPEWRLFEKGRLGVSVFQTSSMWRYCLHGMIVAPGDKSYTTFFNIEYRRILGRFEDVMRDFDAAVFEKVDGARIGVTDHELMDFRVLFRKAMSHVAERFEEHGCRTAPPWWRAEPDRTWDDFVNLDKAYSNVCRVCSNIEFERDWIMGRGTLGTKSISEIPGFKRPPHPEGDYEKGECKKHVDEWNAWIERLKTLASNPVKDA
jgi:hypothetical protein